jgi:hypothetical protein
MVGGVLVNCWQIVPELRLPGVRDLREENRPSTHDDCIQKDNFLTRYVRPELLPEVPASRLLRPAHGDLVCVGGLVVLRRKKKAAVVGTIKLACPHTERASIDPLATEDLF